MAITTREARQLVSTSERSLFESSLPGRVRALTPSRLKDKIARARALRDKYRDLTRRQHQKVQPARSGRPGEDLNARTRRKADVFNEALARFNDEARRRLETERPPQYRKDPATSKEAAQKSRKAGVSASGPAPTPPSNVRRTLAPPVPKSAVAMRSGQHRIHAHVSSAVRRSQGRRDNR